MRAVCIDFETANGFIGSACSVGIAVLEDAIACGNVLLSALSARGVTTIKELSALVGMRLGKLYTGGYNPCSIAKRTSKKA